LVDSRLSAGLKIGAAAFIGYGLYKLFKHEEVTVSAVVTDAGKVVTAPVKAAEVVVKKAGRFIKGSPEAKAHMASMMAKRKPDCYKRAAATRKAHKGHETKKGLSQDQKLKSQESHEKAYRKIKENDESKAKRLIKESKSRDKEYQKGVALGILGGTNDKKARKVAQTALKIDLPKKSSEKRLMKHLAKEHPSTKGKMNITDKEKTRRR